MDQSCINYRSTMVDGLTMDYLCIDDASRGSDLVSTLTPLFAEIKDTNRHPKIPGNTLSNTLLKSRFQSFAADATKQKKFQVKNCAARSVLKNALRAVLIVDVSHDLSLWLTILKLRFQHCAYIHTCYRTNSFLWQCERKVHRCSVL